MAHTEGHGIVNAEHDIYYLCYNTGTQTYNYGLVLQGGYMSTGLEKTECFDTFEELQERGNELGYNIEPIE